MQHVGATDDSHLHLPSLRARPGSAAVDILRGCIVRVGTKRSPHL
jgi:hypothetical protein